MTSSSPPPAPLGSRFDRELVERSLRTKQLGRAFHYHRRTTSTMDDARKLARAGAEHGTVVMAEEQTAGRGTHGRSWVSPAGQNLYFTLVVRPDRERLLRLSMITPLAIANAVEQVTGIFPRIKWPNDVQIKGRKFAGILIEAEWDAGQPAFALIGTGINVNFDPSAHEAAIDRPATSLMLEMGRPLAREPILAAVLNALERAYRGALTDAAYQGWRGRLQTLGRPVTVTVPGRPPLEGVATSATEDGALVVRDQAGELHTFHAGEVTLRTPG